MLGYLIGNHWQACVEMNEICDFTDNCGDSTDEENCGEFTMTNFEVLDDDHDGDPDDDHDDDDGYDDDDDDHDADDNDGGVHLK